MNSCCRLPAVPLLLVAAVAIAALAGPPTAGAAAKRVYAGPPSEVKSAPEGAELVQFFPKRIKVRRGQSVDFHARGFHTFTFAGQTDPPALLVPDGTVSGYEDPAGDPYWFNTQSRYVLNPLAAGPSGDGKVGRPGLEHSGLPSQDGAGAPHRLAFTRKGTFRYLCLIHPRMRGAVKVVGKNRRVPSARRDRARIARQVRKVSAIARERAAYAGPGGAQVRAGNDTREVSLLRFFPRDLTVAAGTEVRWFQYHPHEFHTITFGPASYVDPIADSLFAPDDRGATVLNPLALYPSDPLETVPSHDGNNHGNGFFSSGILTTNRAGTGLTAAFGEFRARFTRPGTYPYLCLTHPEEMKGTVTVTG